MNDKSNFGKADWASLGEIRATEMDTPTNSFVNGRLVGISERVIAIDPTMCMPPTLEEIQALQKRKEAIGVYRSV